MYHNGGLLHLFFHLHGLYGLVIILTLYTIIYYWLLQQKNIGCAAIH